MSASIRRPSPSSGAPSRGLGPRLKGLFAGIHAKITTLPPGVAEAHRDIFAMTHYTYWCGLLVHGGFLVFFSCLGLRGLAIFNVASMLVYAANLVLSRRGRLHAALLFGGLEVTLHQVYATLVLGIDSGFHFFLLILSFATLLYTHLPTGLRIAMAAGPVLLYVQLYTFGIYNPPAVALSPLTLSALAAFNLTAFSTILLGICFYFVNTAMKARVAAENLARAKTLFLANMSHELRTPLNAILGFTHILERSEGLTAQDRRNLATIDRSGEHLLELINHVLDMSKLEDGKLALAETPVDPRAFLDELARMFAPAAARRGLDFQVEPAPDLPAAVFVDELKLRQVLINLLNNALKFTATGSVALSVRAEPESDSAAAAAPSRTGRRRLRFAVRDTGPGIAAEERAQLFQLFTQTSAGLRSGGGTGLGLALSQSLVHLMGGLIEVESTPGRGSTFSFALKLRETAAPAPRLDAAVGPLVPGQPPLRLLVVDDNADNRDVLHQLFLRLGFTVETAEDGESGVLLWQKTAPDLTWMDLQMPGIDGYEATRRIKALAQAAGRPAPVVALTASALAGERERALARGCDDFVTKPFRETDLARILERMLGAKFSAPPAKNTSVPSPFTDADAGAPGFAWPARLAALPAADLALLRTAVDALDLDAAERAVADIETRDPGLAREIRDLLEGYRFDTLASLLSGAPERPTP